MPVLVPVLDELKVMKSHYVTSTSAVKALTQNKFDLVVLDLDLAGAQNALDLANAEGTATPVIVLSKEVEVLQAAAQKRVHFLWKKPVAADLVIRDTKAACGIVKRGANPAYRVPVSIQASANVYVAGGQPCISRRHDHQYQFRRSLLEVHRDAAV